MKIILLLGALLGLSSVMMAAYVDHSLGLFLTGKTLSGLLTAVRYHQLYAVVVSIIGLCISQQIHNRSKLWLTRAAWIFFIGILLFSFSIYLSVMLSAAWVIYFTPIGGVLLMVGWCCLIRVSLLKTK